jgi:hypothetical protein
MFCGTGAQHVDLDWMKLIGLSGYYVSGYKNAADKLVDEAKTDASLFFPVGFLYRQYIEIHLKYLLHCIRWLNVVPLVDSDIHGHELDKLWMKARKALETKWPAPTYDELDAVESIILDFHQVDPSGQELRYAMTKKVIKAWRACREALRWKVSAVRCNSFTRFFKRAAMNWTRRSAQNSRIC